MISQTTQAFRTMFAPWPVQLPQHAQDAYKLFQQNPSHRSLRWKPVPSTTPIDLVRVDRGCRAAGVRSAEEIIWFWTGSHAAYDQLLARL